MKPYIFAIIGKSGSGKSTLAKMLSERLEEYNTKEVVLDTTRPPRENEQDGVDYNFICTAAFLENAKNNKYLDASKFRNWWYGVGYEAFNANGNVIVATPKMLNKLSALQHKYNIIPIYCQAGSFTRLKRNVKREGHMRPEHIRRIAADNIDFKGIDEILDRFQYVIKVNTQKDGKTFCVGNILTYLYTYSILNRLKEKS